MSHRTVEDHLREEYFDLLPEITRVTEHLKAQIQYSILPIARRLKKYESLIVRSRIKDCTSAIDTLRRRRGDGKQREGAIFDNSRPQDYSLLQLRDLAGVRVLMFPSERTVEIDETLRKEFPNWKSDPVIDRETGQNLASKYFGFCHECSEHVQGEYQVVSMLTGLFWEVEHAALYKPAPNLKGIASSLAMQERTADVYRALAAFESEFESQLRIARSNHSS